MCKTNGLVQLDCWLGVHGISRRGDWRQRTIWLSSVISSVFAFISIPHSVFFLGRWCIEVTTKTKACCSKRNGRAQTHKTPSSTFPLIIQSVGVKNYGIFELIIVYCWFSVIFDKTASRIRIFCRYCLARSDSNIFETQCDFTMALFIPLMFNSPPRTMEALQSYCTLTNIVNWSRVKWDVNRKKQMLG